MGYNETEMRLIYSSRKLYPDLEQRCLSPRESFVDFYDEVNGKLERVLPVVFDMTVQNSKKSLGLGKMIISKERSGSLLHAV